MNKKLNLAVAGAVLAFGAASAQAGIIIPAGEWTLDVSGNVNTFYSNTNFGGSLEQNYITATYAAVTGALTAGVLGSSAGPTGLTNTVKTVSGYQLSSRATNGALTRSANEISTGLLPSAIGFGGKTRQNNIDVAFQTTFFVGANTATSGVGSWGNNNASLNSLNIRQAFLTFGDKSWGQFKLGRDLGVFGSDAILSDMTLLGVGTGAGGAGSSTLGRIGSGYLYADWIGQIQYQSPNFSGFQVTGAVREPLANSANHEVGVEGKATFDFAASDVTGRIWVGGIHQKIAAASAAASTTYLSTTVSGSTRTDVFLYDAGSSGFTKTAEAAEIGAKISAAGFSLVGYYYDGKNIGQPIMLNSGIPASGLTFNNADSADHDVRGGYVQGTFTVPNVGTKIGASWGRSEIEGTAIGLGNSGSSTYENESWIVGAYHPLTKHLNLVAEYTDSDYKNIGYYNGYNGKARTGSLGAILFF